MTLTLVRDTGEKTSTTSLALYIQTLFTGDVVCSHDSQLVVVTVVCIKILERITVADLLWLEYEVFGTKSITKSMEQYNH